MSELNGIISTKGSLKGTINSTVKTNGTVSVGGTLITSNLSKKGDKGDDGYSPTATVTKVGDTATITITDKNGTTTATVKDGSGGGASAFVAVFGTTSYADVKDAYDDDAIIICALDDSGNTAVYQLAYFDATNEIFYFTEANSNGWYWTSISNADGWDSGSFDFASTDTATTLADGLMSSSDKSKLDNIASGAEVNVQSDWSQSDNTKDDYIKNKPTIPSKTSDLANDSNFLHGNTKGVFYGTCSTAASTAAKEVTISGFASSDRVIGAVVFVMMGHTNTASVSNLTLNVSGTGAKSIKYINNGSLANLPSAGYLETPNVYPFYYDGDYWICMFNSTPAIHNVPSGGSSGQVLAKSSGTDYDVGWVNQSGGSVTDVTQNGTSVVSSGVAAVTVPTDTGDLTNGAGFITTETDPTVPSWAKAVSKPSYTFSEIGSTPSTLSGYGITDAKISSGTITLGSNSITPLTSFTETDPVFTASAAHGISSSDISNWNGKSDFSGSYNDLTDKPTIPTVNNATLTIQKNGTNVNTFTANASSNVTANITVHDVPSGGSANQVLAKNSNADYDLKWTSAGGGGGTLVQLVRW